MSSNIESPPPSPPQSPPSEAPSPPPSEAPSPSEAAPSEAPSPSEAAPSEAAPSEAAPSEAPPPVLPSAEAIANNYRNRLRQHNILLNAINNIISDQMIEAEEEHQLEMALQESLRTHTAYKQTISDKGLLDIKEEKYNPSIHQNDKCPITMEELTDWEGPVAMLPCKHVALPESMYTWLKEKPVCPICRTAMDSKEIKIEQTQAEQPPPAPTTYYPTNSSLLNTILSLNVEEDIHNSRNTLLRHINNIPRTD